MRRTCITLGNNWTCEECTSFVTSWNAIIHSRPKNYVIFKKDTIGRCTSIIPFLGVGEDGVTHFLCVNDNILFTTGIVGNSLFTTGIVHNIVYIRLFFLHQVLLINCLQQALLTAFFTTTIVDNRLFTTGIVDNRLFTTGIVDNSSFTSGIVDNFIYNRYC